MMEISKNHHWVILLFGIIIALGTFIRIYLSTHPEKEKKNTLIAPVQNLAVEIRGRVSKPGIYFLSSGSCLKDLLDEAGFISQEPGLTHWQTGLPLRAGDGVTLDQNETGGTVVSIRPMEARKLFFLNLPIDVNAATETDLMVIPGIGPKTARSIVSYKIRWGPFSKIADLKKVPGLGDKRLGTVSKYLAVKAE
jgi:competence protein ComEA